MLIIDIWKQETRYVIFHPFSQALMARTVSQRMVELRRGPGEMKLVICCHEKNPALLSMKYCLFNRDPYNGLLYALYNGLLQSLHYPLHNPTNQVFFRGSGVPPFLRTFFFDSLRYVLWSWLLNYFLCKLLEASKISNINDSTWTLGGEWSMNYEFRNLPRSEFWDANLGRLSKSCDCKLTSTCANILLGNFQECSRQTDIAIAPATKDQS